MAIGITQSSQIEFAAWLDVLAKPDVAESFPRTIRATPLFFKLNAKREDWVNSFIIFHIRDRRENILNNGVLQKPLVTLLRAMLLSAEQFNEIEQGLATVVLKRLLAINLVQK
jgi:hypothetical protein